MASVVQCGFGVAIGGSDVRVITHHHMAGAAGAVAFAPNKSVLHTSAQQCEPLAGLQLAHIPFHFSPLMSLSVLLA